MWIAQSSPLIISILPIISKRKMITVIIVKGEKHVEHIPCAKYCSKYFACIMLVTDLL